MSNVLIVTDDEQAHILVSTLAKASDGPFNIECVTLLSAASSRIEAGDVDLVLAKLDLPDSSGIVTFDRLLAAARHVPIMTLAEDDGETLAREAVQRGSQGYLTKGHYHSSLVPQALRNVIERKAVEEALHNERAYAQATLKCIGDAVISVDMAGAVTYCNPKAEQLIGWNCSNANGRRVTEVMHLIDSETRQVLKPHPVLQVIQSGEPGELISTALLVRADGYEMAIEDSIAPIFGKFGENLGAVVVFRDVSESRAMSEKMSHLANHDYLTGLPNRVLLNDRLAHEIMRAERKSTSIAVLFLDLDNFKHINDSLGHEVGDMLLKAVAKKLRSCVRNMDTVCRMGGDEFVILLADNITVERIAGIADKIISSLSQSNLVAGQELNITTSIGASIYPADGHDVTTLIKHADTAMYTAKEKGRNNYQFFHQEMNQRAIERQLIESNLRRAISGQEFVLRFQPKLDLETNKVIGAEALLRWNHPSWGMVSPDRFITIAEESGLIVPIGRWVLREACLQAKRWLDSGTGSSFVAVNISALEFRQKDFFESVRAIVEETGLPPSYLQLEITESVVMNDAAASASTLNQLQEQHSKNRSVICSGYYRSRRRWRDRNRYNRHGEKPSPSRGS
jgi:diguanylate cyclase (GGDEF)-like protein/PAS domain S-box-containing protein